jgi:hypothetical protein
MDMDRIRKDRWINRHTNRKSDRQTYGQMD